MDLSNEDNKVEKKSVHWIFFFRQLFSCGVITLNYFIFGMYTGSYTIITAQIRKEANSTDVITEETASWLASVSSYSAVPWTIIYPMIAYRFGRKIPLILISINILVVNIVFYCSESITELIISQALLGLSVGSTPTIGFMVTSEYTSPKYRGIFLTLEMATIFWGIWIANAVGTFFNWRNISILIFVCDIYNLLSLIFYSESPYWLATKGHFDKCIKVHRWLKGTNEDSERELVNLILTQKEHLNFKKTFNKRINHAKCTKLLSVIRSKEFYKPFVYASLPLFLFNLSGKVVCSVYAIDILIKITSDEQIAYEGMLMLDGVTVLGMYVGCFLSRIITRRKQLLFCSSVGVGFLYVLSCYLYMTKFNLISGNNYVSLLLLSGFSISISCGPIILAPTCSAELTPLRYRSYFVCCFALMSNTIFATILKISPFIFKYCGIHGTFLFYSISSNVFICLLYKYLPETKDKTISEIQAMITKKNQSSSIEHKEPLSVKEPLQSNKDII